LENVLSTFDDVIGANLKLATSLVVKSSSNFSKEESFVIFSI